MTNAADRVEAFLDMRQRLPNLHEDLITGVGHEGGIAALTVSDLQNLVASARVFDYPDDSGLYAILAATPGISIEACNDLTERLRSWADR